MEDLHRRGDFIMEGNPQTWYETVAGYWVWIVGFLGAIAFIWKTTKGAKKEVKPFWQTVRRFIDVVSVVKILDETVKTGFAMLEENRKSDLALIEAVVSENHFLQAQLNTMTDMMPTPQWKADDKGNCIFANDAFCDILGLTFEELEGDGWASIFPQSMRESDMAAWDRAVAKKTKFFRVVHIKAADNKLLKAKLRATPLFDKARNFKVYHCSLTVIGDVSN